MRARLNLLTVAGMLLIGMIVIGFPSKPAAATTTNIMPAAADFTHSVRLLVGSPSSAGQGINAKTSIVKVYSPSRTVGVYISHFGECYNGPNVDNYDWYPHGGSSPGSTLYEIYGTDANENSTGSALTSANNGGTCSANRTLNATHAGNKSTRRGHTDFYVFVFKATMLGTGFGWNAFYLNSATAGAYIGYSDRSGDEFAIKPIFNESDGPEYSTFNFEFATSCEITSPVTKSMIWFDADQGQANQLRTIQFDLVDQTTGTTVISNYTSVGGQNASGSRSVTFQPGHKYLWRWENVSSYNGLQLEVPFDSIYYDLNCPAGTVQPSSVVDKPTMTYPDTATFSHYANVSNYGGSAAINWSVQRYRNGAASGLPNTGTYNTTGNGQFLLRTNTFNSVIGDAGDRICERLTLSGPSNVTFTGNPSESCTSIVARPYVTGTNNDTWAGSNFDFANANCSGLPARTSAITSWFENGGGSFAEYGLFGSGAITDFGSANQAGSLALTFANTPALGALGAPTRCIPNYIDTVGESGEPWPGFAGIPANAGKKKYYFNGSHLLGSGGVVPVGTQVIFMVNGDATIGGNITYADSYTGANDISSFWLIAKGNINIEEDVTNVSGFLVAQGTSAAPGKVQTCVRVNQLVTYNPLTTGVCNNALEVFGAVVADEIYWQRTRGTTGSGQSAETIQFDPGLYLSSPYAPVTTASPAVEDSKDLPPIY